MPHRPPRGRRGRRARETAALAAALLAFHTPHRARAAGTFAVTTAADTGPGSLRQAILDADAAGGGTINMNPGGPIFLTAALPIVSTPMTINGGNTLVHGNFTYRVFFVDVANGGAVALNNLTIGAGRAHGGNGGLGGGGGGGLGAGGGLFVNRGNVTVSNVSFQNNAAIGGTGGAYGGAGPGGGGGLGGNGGTASGGGGGYAGAGGNGNVNGGGGGGGLDTNGENASGTFSGRGGGEGGVGPAYGGGNNSQASPPFYDMRGAGGGGSLASPGTDASFFNGGSGGRFGGGGAAGQSSSVYGRYAGNGGEFGGGGSGARGGNGGFGGGGGVGYFAGGVGGFGGGGGGANAYYAFGAGGAFAGDGGLDETGGGGAALGAHIFVRGGASLTLLDSAADRGTVTPGAGAAPGPSGNAPLSGQAAGESFFLSGITPLAVSGTNTRTIGGSIADVGAFLNHPTASGFSYATLVKTGTGALVLSQSNAYRGGTVISQGTISHDGSASTPLGPGTVTFNDAATGAADTTLLLGFINTDTFVNPIVVADFGSGTATLASIPVAAQPLIFTGPVTLNRNLTVRAQNANPLTPQNEPGQTRFDGLVSGPGGLTITGGRMLQFRNAAKTYAGRTLVTDNSTLSLYSSSSTPANSTVQIDPGSTVVLEGLAAGVLGGLAGAGTLTHNPAWGATSTLEVGRNNQDTAFTGQITGAILLTKAGTGTLDLGAQDNTTIFLTVAAGRVRLTADQHLQNMRVNDTDPGVQTLDLNGHAMRFNGFAFAMVALEDFLNRHVGTAADGLYDSTAPAHPGSAIGIAFTPATGEAVRMKLTLTGDANLDGKVDFNDLVALAQHYNTASATTYWDNGDFTYDRRVDFNDLVLLAQSYNGTFAAAPIPGATSDFNHDLATAFATVPEPGTFAVIAAACGLTGATRPQKRRRHAAPNRTKAPQ